MQLPKKMLSLKGLPALAAATLILHGEAPLSPEEEAREKNERAELIERIRYSSPDRKIDKMQIHHVIDRNKDGFIQIPEEVERIYFNSSKDVSTLLHIKEVIPARGKLDVQVPQHFYWNTTIDVRVVELYPRKNHLLVYKTNHVDLRNVSMTNSIPYTAQSVMVLEIEGHAKWHYDKFKVPLSGNHTLHGTIIGKNGYMHSFICTIDYSNLQNKVETGNTVPISKHNPTNFTDKVITP